MSDHRFSARRLAALLGDEYPPTAQQAAVIEAPPNRLIVAGAGSGKRETMAGRVVWLIANGLMHPANRPRPHLHPQGRRRVGPPHPKRLARLAGSAGATGPTADRGRHHRVHLPRLRGRTGHRARLRAAIEPTMRAGAVTGASPGNGLASCAGTTARWSAVELAPRSVAARSWTSPTRCRNTCAPPTTSARSATDWTALQPELADRPALPHQAGRATDHGHPSAEQFLPWSRIPEREKQARGDRLRRPMALAARISPTATPRSA